jgi:spermidine synthase
VTRPWRTLATVPTGDGPLELRQRGPGDFLIVVGGRVLMTSVARRSEEALAERAVAALRGRRAPRVLIGGLGMGYTLRAALDALPRAARVLVAELSAAVVDWCRGPLAGLTGAAVADPRVDVLVADVARTIAARPAASLDAIVLDLYEGPYAATQADDDPRYGRRALEAAHRALAAGGVLAVWAEDEDPGFARRLAAAGFTATTYREGHGGRRHVVYVAERAAPVTAPASAAARGRPRAGRSPRRR